MTRQYHCVHCDGYATVDMKAFVWRRTRPVCSLLWFRKQWAPVLLCFGSAITPFQVYFEAPKKAQTDPGSRPESHDGWSRWHTSARTERVRRMRPIYRAVALAGGHKDGYVTHREGSQSGRTLLIFWRTVRTSGAHCVGKDTSRALYRSSPCYSLAITHVLYEVFECEYSIRGVSSQ